ncbi:MAG: hypothetical protein CM15mP3_07170 [Candidatus Poseidoniales archaeon]|nr:MAG: hypothetical protein CM15mP3_07170 [Candidatus Poseidoniales archaeon]
MRDFFVCYRFGRCETYRVNAVASVSEFTVNLNPLQLNIAKHEVENISLTDVLSLPISVTTEFGATTTAFDYQSYLHHVDSIDSINRTQWLPGQELAIATSHIRFNPLTMSEIGYAIDRVELIAAATSSVTIFNLRLRCLDYIPLHPHLPSSPELANYRLTKTNRRSVVITGIV